MVSALVIACVEALAPKEAARVTVSIEPDDAMVEVPPRALRRCLSNLIRNALDASETGAPVEIVATCAFGSMNLAVRDRGAGPRLCWTTPSWILHEALEDGDPGLRAMVDAAVGAGDLAWHAAPFTTHTELVDRSLFAHGLSISARLDQRFGRRTRAAKMTDVPGHTRSIVPLLSEAGVRFLHLGVNEASPVPDVPEVPEEEGEFGTVESPPQATASMNGANQAA